MITPTQTSIPVSQLRIDKANVRVTDIGLDPMLVASIAARGVLTPLRVRANGKGYVVIDGGKRLTALQALVSEKKLDADHQVPCTLVETDDAGAREDSLTLNVVRTAMHPVDEYEAFVRLASDKERPLDVDAIAQRFGLTRKHVEQRLALGELADQVRDAWRQGKLKAEAAQAFTLCADKKAQVRIYSKLAKERGRIDAWDVKQELKVGRQSGRLLNVVGIDAYAARGGKVTRDLFGDDHVVSDAELLQAMVKEKIDAVCKQLTDEGWSFAKQRGDDWWHHPHIEVKTKPTADEKKQLAAFSAVVNDDDAEDELRDAAERDHDALELSIWLRSITPEQKAKSGCYVEIDDRGNLTIDYGRVLDTQSKGSSKSKDAKSDKTGKPEKKKPAALSNALSQRLNLQMLSATRSALLADKQPGELAQILAGIVAQQIDSEKSYGMPIEVRTMLPKIRAAITPKVMNEHQRSTFDAEDYFKSAPKPLVLAAISEAVNADEARKVAGEKKGEIAKFAIDNVPKTKWVPPALRAPHYDGPTKKPASSQKRKLAPKRGKAKR